ncbi:hypothetical protein VCR31J2_1270667 [Vibrio coralliirubri]|uniref:Uncharacterized protein n=1 Tax=Vibrio coralliirubri TaxID=1516159 RepID=A0AA86WXY7_9VIBR|nr:hypothetical protein VCR31J2_1270667 [Vibrio coralliirubri]
MVCWVHAANLESFSDVRHRQLFLVAWAKYQFAPVCRFKLVCGPADLAVFSLVEQFLVVLWCIGRCSLYRVKYTALSFNLYIYQQGTPTDQDSTDADIPYRAFLYVVFQRVQFSLCFLQFTPFALGIDGDDPAVVSGNVSKLNI